MIARKNLLLLLILSFYSFTNFSFSQDGLQKEYYPGGKLKSEINYYSGVREGEAKFYYENGNLKEERLYINGRVEGLVRYYNEAGKMVEMANLENGKREGPTSVFDSTGAYITDIFYTEGKKVIETSHYYDLTSKDSLEIAAVRKAAREKAKLVAVKRKKQNGDLPPEIEEEIQIATPAFYKDIEIEVKPEPVGGPDQIQKKVYYPTQARENGIQGTVKILTVIDEYGEVKQADVVEGIGYGCDESARIAVYYTRFKPGLQRGKAVRVQMTIPIEFKINP